MIFPTSRLVGYVSIPWRVTQFVVLNLAPFWFSLSPAQDTQDTQMTNALGIQFSNNLYWRFQVQIWTKWT